MARNQSFWIISLLLLCFANFGLSLKCFVCQSHIDKNCEGSKIGMEHLKDCDQLASEDPDSIKGAKYHACRTLTTWVDFNVNENEAQTRVTRKCGFIESKYDNTCYYRAGLGGRTEVCSCTDNGCNSFANGILPSKSIIGLGIFSILALMFKGSF